MILQLLVAGGVGLIGLLYCVTYETFVTARGFRKHGVQWVILRNRRRTRALLGFTLLWPCIEEALVRGLPMFFVTDRFWLGLVLVVMNVVFMFGHLDRDIIGADTQFASFFTRHSWVISRLGGGLLFLIPAVGFHNLYGCIALHSAWNLYAVVKQLKLSPYALWHGRIIVLAVQPFEILVDPGLEPSTNFRKLFRGMRTYRYDSTV